MTHTTLLPEQRCFGSWPVSASRYETALIGSAATDALQSVPWVLRPPRGGAQLPEAGAPACRTLRHARDTGLSRGRPAWMLSSGLHTAHRWALALNHSWHPRIVNTGHSPVRALSDVPCVNGKAVDFPGEPHRQLCAHRLSRREEDHGEPPPSRVMCCWSPPPPTPGRFWFWATDSLGNEEAHV